MSSACALKRTISSRDFFPLHDESNITNIKRPMFQTESIIIDGEENQDILFDKEPHMNMKKECNITKNEKKLKTNIKEQSLAVNVNKNDVNHPNMTMLTEFLQMNDKKSVIKPLLKLDIKNNTPSKTILSLTDAPSLTCNQIKTIILNEYTEIYSNPKLNSFEDILLLRKLKQLLLQDDSLINCQNIKKFLDLLKQEKTVNKDYLESCKLFSLNEVSKMCNEGWKKRELQLKSYFEQQLKQLLHEQHSEFMRFQQETITTYVVKPEYSTTPSYIS